MFKTRIPTISQMLPLSMRQEFFRRINKKAPRIRWGLYVEKYVERKTQ